MDVWASAEYDDHEQICFFSDPPSGLRAIIAIHSTALGPAVGGTRFKSYPNDRLALDDALRLSRAMSYKSALAGLPVGGGKSMIIGDPDRLKSRPLLHAFGRFVDRLGSSYAAGEDVGTTVADMEVINEVTPFVGGTSTGAGDPSIHTAVGVLHGLEAVLRWRFDRSDFAGLRVAVQGLGAVGWALAARLHQAGAILVVADVRADRVERAAKLLGAAALPVDRIHRAEADVFAPCALGGAITEQNAREIRAGAVAGAANNQLASARAGEILAQRGILFAPDFVINAGGIISGLEATTRMPGRPRVDFPPLSESLAAIDGRLMRIFARAAEDGRTPEATAEQMARELIGR